MDAIRTITLTGGHRALQKESAYLFLPLRCDRPPDHGARFSLDGIDIVELGRSDRLRAERTSENGATELHIGIPDHGISSVHARLEKVLGTWMLEDRKSKNGTQLDGKRIEPAPRAPLPDSPTVALGHTFSLLPPHLPSNRPEALHGKHPKPPA